MTGSEDWRDTHGNLSALDLKFREMAKDSPLYLDRQQYRVLEGKRDLLRFPIQPWPTFLGAEKLAEIERASLGIVRLLRSIPERIFQRNAEKLAAFYDVSLVIAQVLFSPPTGIETMLSRGDFIETAGGFKCIEFNFTPNLGGWDVGIAKGLQLSAPPTARFIASEGLRIRFKDPLAEMFRFVLDRARQRRDGSGEVAFAFNVAHHELASFAGSIDHFDRELKRVVEAMGLDFRARLVPSSNELLVSRDNKVFVGQQKIEAIFEISGPQPPPHVYRVFKTGAVELYDGPLASMVSSKRNIALLSQHADAFPPEDRAFIEAHVPWTRLVAPGEVDYAGRMWSLVELLTGQQKRFVLKDAHAYGGQGVVMGNFASTEEWRRTLDRALAAKDWVVQEVQASRPYLYQSGDYGCSIHDVIWGPFVFGDRFGGVLLRMQPRAAGGAVNLSLHATEGIVFEV